VEALGANTGSRVNPVNPALQPPFTSPYAEEFLLVANGGHLPLRMNDLAASPAYR
jgi:hypothetical protein